MSGPRKWADEELIEQVRTLGEKLGRAPKEKEFNGRDAGACVRTVARRFGSWSAAAKLAGFEPNDNRKYTDEELLDAIRACAEGDVAPTMPAFDAEGAPHAKLIARRFGSWSAGVERAGFEPRTAGRDPEYSDDEIIDAIRLFHATLRKAPSAAEFDDAPVGMSVGPAIRAFGSWADAVRAAGLTPRGEGGEKGGDSS